MKKTAFLHALFGFAVTTFLGTLFHFLYEWTGKSIPAAIISGVNESTWEHMKLMFFPLFFLTVGEFIFRCNKPRNFFTVKLIGILIGIILIPIIFYTVRGSLGSTSDLFNIAIFYISAAAVFLFESAAFSGKITVRKIPFAPIIILAIMALFTVFTFYPPEIPLFEDPVTGIYGIP